MNSYHLAYLVNQMYDDWSFWQREAFKFKQKGNYNSYLTGRADSARYAYIGLITMADTLDYYMHGQAD